MADVYASSKTNWLRDLTARKARTGKLTLGKVQPFKMVGTKLTFGKAS